MKKDYWNIQNAQVVEKTGKKIDDWIAILDDFNAAGKKSTEAVLPLQQQYDGPRYGARTLTTLYLKSKA